MKTKMSREAGPRFAGKKYILIYLVTSLFLSWVNIASAQSTDYTQGGKNPVSSSIQKYLCAPTETPAAQQNIVPNTPGALLPSAVGGTSGQQLSYNSGANNPAQNDLYLCVNKLYKFFIVLASAIAVGFIVIAGYIYINSGGNSEAVDKAKSILETSLTAIVILFIGYILLKALNPDIISFRSVQPGSVKLDTTACPPGSTLGKDSNTGANRCFLPDGTVTTTTAQSNNCNQSFGLGASSGCSGSSCVNVSTYTSSHDCASNGGTCLLSSQAAARAQTFINKFNQLGNSGGCTLKISAAIEGSSGPSASSCHKDGTCVDFNLLPYNTTCQQIFYTAAQQSGSVVSFLDEYNATCKASTTTGGNIHVNF